MKNKTSILLTVILSAVLALVDHDGEPVLADQAAEAPRKTPDQLYLEENAANPGVIVRPSGLQIKVLRRGSGKFPDEESVVKVDYEGRLIDGTKFDSSYDRGEPAEFQLQRVIDGWQEALLLMQIGSEWEITVPADLAYGEEGAGEVIPPGATLIFKVELIEIVER